MTTPQEGEPQLEEREKDEFHIEEYKALRAEILVLKQFQFVIQKWVVVALGIVYGLGFGVTTDKSFLPSISKSLLLFAGFAAVVFGATSYSITDSTMWHISEYLKQIEDRFAKGKGPKGWEHFTSKTRPIWGVRKNPFWLALLAFSGSLLLYEWIFKIPI